MTRAEISTLFQAEAVALQAKCGRVDPQTLTFLAARVQGAQSWGLPIGRVVIAMLASHRDREELARHGSALQEAVSQALRPQPVDLHRVDIHG